MLVFEFKGYGKPQQCQAIDEAIRVTQFIRNKAIRAWIDGTANSQYEFNKLCTPLAKEYDFAAKLNSMARQSAAERAWSAVARFYANCKRGIPGKKGYPKFQKNCRSVEYKTSGWKLSEDRKSITFTDKLGIGQLKLKGTRDLGFHPVSAIKRVRIIRRADGYYMQFCIAVDRKETLPPSGRAVGLDVGLKSFYTDSNGEVAQNPRFYRQGEKKLKQRQRQISRKVRASANRRKAVNRLARQHLKISRQRKDHAIKLARCVVQSNDLVAYEDLRIGNLTKNHCLAKSINDAGWYQFRTWLERYGAIYSKVTVAVNPAYTSQNCSSCGATVKKSLSTRTHICQCGCELDRDHNAAINILKKGLNTVGHTEIYAWGEIASTRIGENLFGQADS